MLDDDQKLKESIETAVNTTGDREVGRYALALLFPKAEKLLKTYVYSGSDDIHERRRKRRISVADSAPAYFRLSPSRSNWGRSEIDHILAQPDPATAFDGIEKKIATTADHERPRLRRLLLQEFENAFGRTRALTVAWLRFLVMISGSYIEARDETTIVLFPDENSDRLRRIVLRGLIPLTPPERATLFKAIIPDAKDLSLLCDVVRAIEGDVQGMGEKRDRTSEVTLGIEADSVRAMLVTRIKQLTSSGQLWVQARVGTILWFWWGCGREKDVRSFTDGAMHEPDGIRALLNVPVGLVRSSNGNYEQVAPYWDKIVNLRTLAEKAREVLQNSPSETDRQLAQRFIDALNRKDHA